MKINLINILTESIRRKTLLNKLGEMGFSDEESEVELENLIDTIHNLPDPVKLYRIVYVDSKKEIDLEKPGTHYSRSKQDLLDSHSHTTGYGEKKFLITVLSPKKLIDKTQTLENNILYPNENEVTLKNKGKGVEIISVREIKKD